MKFPAFLIAFTLASSCAPKAPEIDIIDAWSRATAPGQSSAAIYATIRNRGGPDRLIEVSSGTGMAMLHRSNHEGGVARMRMLSELAIPDGDSVSLAPGGTHVMLTGLGAPLAVGANFPLVLRFDKAGPRTVTVVIVPAGAG